MWKRKKKQLPDDGTKVKKERWMNRSSVGRGHGMEEGERAKGAKGVGARGEVAGERMEAEVVAADLE